MVFSRFMQTFIQSKQYSDFDNVKGKRDYNETAFAERISMEEGASGEIYLAN